MEKDLEEFSRWLEYCANHYAKTSGPPVASGIVSRIRRWKRFVDQKRFDYEITKP